MSRGLLGDRGGLDDFREAIRLATEGGQGREVAILHHNLGISLWRDEGPADALEVLRAGIEFALTRGLTEVADMMTATSAELLFDSGEHERALTVAAEIAGRAEASGNLHNLANVRMVQARILTLRGQAAQTGDWLDWLETTSRETQVTEITVAGLGSAAVARAALEQHDAAATVLAEVETAPDGRTTDYYAAYLPAMVRTALTIGDPELAERLVTGIEPRTPIAEHALVTVHAALAEASGDAQAAADGNAETAERWQQFGVIPEQAHALLRQGRCLTALGQPAEATRVLVQAREIFETLKAAPAVVETDALLDQASALTA
jgi:ATP/maltotriose-dependent transcriptional regulator MalT